MLSAAGPEHLKKLRGLLIKGAYERRDVWPDRAAAMAALRKRETMAKWDLRVLEVFIKYGIVPHQGSYYKESPYNGVTLACTRDQEAAMYRDPDGATKPVADLTKACGEKPVHLILGGIKDFMPKRTHEALTDPTSGRKFASVTIIPEAGHLVPLEVPDRLGEVIYDCLIESGAISPLGGGNEAPVRSRL
ncbi:hypothetical protein V5O48_017829 [Marasmius crinis-equi]|uniref:AB hydrolase-1 domain-containing protein n=1 Tax=Marasmius crinis-equi TaxID=585013 RepID=A0ABR3EMY5_9AGAR